MKKSAKPRRVKAKPPPDQHVVLFAEMTKLVMLGAGIYHAGMKQAMPTAPTITPEFTFNDPKPREAKDEEKLPEV